MMAPAAGLMVDDSQHGGLTHEFLNVPGCPVELFGAAGPVVRTGGGANDFAFDHQVDTQRARVSAPADQEVEIRPFDRERRRGQRSGRPVPLHERVDQPTAEKPGDGHLAGQGAVGGTAAESLAFGSPAAVSVPLEVGNDHVRAVGGGRVHSHDHSQK